MQEKKINLSFQVLCCSLKGLARLQPTTGDARVSWDAVLGPSAHGADHCTAAAALQSLF